MAIVTIEDRTGSIDAVVFSDAYAIAGPLLAVERIVYLKGKVDRQREEPNILVDTVIPLERGAAELTQAVKIILRESDVKRNGNGVKGELESLRLLLRRMAAANGAAAAVYIEVRQAGLVVSLRVNGARVAVSADMPQRIAAVMRAENCCELIGPAKALRPDDSSNLLQTQNAAQ